eukprot:PhF_6_TR17010/c0_g1_i2/m.25772
MSYSDEDFGSDDSHDDDKVAKPAPKDLNTDPVARALESGIWREVKDPTSGKSYFYNTSTRETTWDLKATLGTTAAPAAAPVVTPAAVVTPVVPTVVPTVVTSSTLPDKAVVVTPPVTAVNAAPKTNTTTSNPAPESLSSEVSEWEGVKPSSTLPATATSVTAVKPNEESPHQQNNAIPVQSINATHTTTTQPNPTTQKANDSDDMSSISEYIPPTQRVETQQPQQHQQQQQTYNTHTTFLIEPSSIAFDMTQASPDQLRGHHHHVLIEPTPGPRLRLGSNTADELMILGGMGRGGGGGDITLNSNPLVTPREEGEEDNKKVQFVPLATGEGGNAQQQRLHKQPSGSQVLFKEQEDDDADVSALTLTKLIADDSKIEEIRQHQPSQSNPITTNNNNRVDPMKLLTDELFTADMFQRRRPAPSRVTVDYDKGKGVGRAGVVSYNPQRTVVNVGGSVHIVPRSLPTRPMLYTAAKETEKLSQKLDDEILHVFLRMMMKGTSTGVTPRVPRPLRNPGLCPELANADDVRTLLLTNLTQQLISSSSDVHTMQLTRVLLLDILRIFGEILQQQCNTDNRGGDVFDCVYFITYEGPPSLEGLAKSVVHCLPFEDMPIPSTSLAKKNNHHHTTSGGGASPSFRLESWMGPTHTIAATRAIQVAIRELEVASTYEDVSMLTFGKAQQAKPRATAAAKTSSQQMAMMLPVEACFKLHSSDGGGARSGKKNAQQQEKHNSNRAMSMSMERALSQLSKECAAKSSNRQVSQEDVEFIVDETVREVLMDNEIYDMIVRQVVLRLGSKQ